MARPVTPEIERFNRSYKIDSTGCWLWTGSVDKDGYGHFKWKTFNTGRNKRAHKFSWSFHNQCAVPDGKCVLHICDKPACVNPAHLWLGTHQQNVADRHAKGRNADQRGSKAHQAILNEAQVIEIRQSVLSDTELAIKMGVARTTISSVRHRYTWAHLE